MPFYTLSENQPKQVDTCIHCNAALYHCDDWLYPKWETSICPYGQHETEDTDEPIDDINALCTWKW